MIILHIFAIYGLIVMIMDGIRAYKVYKLEKELTKQFNYLRTGGKK